MAGLILIGIIVVMLLVLFVQMFRNKPLKKLLLSYAVILGSYILYATYTCGPNRADVRMMKPMAQKIADYIVANGIPESLKDIPELPYKLEECERNENYRDNHNNITSEEKALVYKINETCKYANKITIELSATLDLKDNTWGGVIEQTALSETVLYYPFEKNKKNVFKFDDMDIGSHKDDGICNPMRQ